MPTIGQSLDTAEERLFVNRRRELGIFRDWLSGGPPLLKVDGPGGMGKTALVRAFRREALRRHRDVVFVDAADVVAQPDAFLDAIAPGRGPDAGRMLSDRGAMLILDTFERVYSLTPFLQEEFLPELDEGVRVVLAGRHPLGRPWATWSDLMWTVNLARLGHTEVEDYLERRGVADAAIRDAVWRATYGHPLAVSLAADMAADLGIREFAAQPEWHLSVRELVEELLRDIDETRLRRLLEAASCVRQFDEPTLAAMSGDDDVSSAFAQLCQLSVVRPGEHGLMLHDDIRHILVEDLRWRHPERYEDLRSRALSFYRRRARNAPPEHVTWINLDRLFLSEQALVHARVFGEADPTEYWVQSSLPTPDTIRPVFEGWATLGEIVPDPPPVDELSWEFVEAVLAVPGARVPVCRDRDGAAIGYGFFIPVAEESLALLPDGVVKTAITDWCRATETPLPARVAATSIWYLSTIALRDEAAAVAIPPLTRACFESMTTDRGEYLVLTREPVYQALAEACGFYGVGTADDGRGRPLTTYHVDVETLGPESFVEGLLTFARPPQTFRGAALTRELEAVLSCWDSVAALDQSALAPWVAHRLPGEGRPGAQVRQLVESCLRELSEHAGDDRDAVRAVELAYLEPGVSHDAAVRRLNVSRATFYRLRRRGIAALTDAVWRRLQASS